MPLTLEIIPGYTDLQDAALTNFSPAFGIHLEAISANAAFGKVRTEIFHGLYVHGDTVPLPVSPIDKYQYSREECLYFYNVALSTNKDSGWIQVGCGSLWFTDWFVDQATGEVSSLQWYRNGGSGGARTETNDGQILVVTIAHRQRTTLLMSATPTYSTINEADIATDKPWTQSLAQSLNANAKFSVNNHEIFYCGEFISLEQVPLSTLVSPDDGYAYSYAETQFLGFWRWTTASAAAELTQPPESLAFLGPFAWTIDATGHVGLFMERIDNDGTDTVVGSYGRIGVFAFCKRAGTPSTAPLATSFTEIDETKFVPGSTLRASDVLQIKKNIDEAIVTPEFFGVTEYANGDVIPLPVSPVDGYTYSRDELTYLWAWNAIRPNTGGNVRIPIFYGGITESTGFVTLNTWRLTSHYVDDNNSLSRMKVMVIGRRSQHPRGAIPVSTGNPPTDWPTNDVVQPYAIKYDMGGARKTPPDAGEILLVDVVPTLPTGFSTIKFTAGLFGSTAGTRTPPAGGYSVLIKLNGGVIGQIVFAGTVGSFSFPNDILVTPGETISFEGGPADPNIVGMYWTMIGNRY